MPPCQQLVRLTSVISSYLSILFNMYIRRFLFLQSARLNYVLRCMSTMLCCAMPYPVPALRALPCPALPCSALPCPALPCSAMLCPAMLCRAVPCRAVLCRAVLCMPCCRDSRFAVTYAFLSCRPQEIGG